MGVDGWFIGEGVRENREGARVCFDGWMRQKDREIERRGICGDKLVVCSQPDPTQLAGLGWFLGLGGFGWVTKFFLIVSRVGFVS